MDHTFHGLQTPEAVLLRRLLPRRLFEHVAIQTIRWAVPKGPTNKITIAAVATTTHVNHHPSPVDHTAPVAGYSHTIQTRWARDWSLPEIATASKQRWPK